MASKKDKKRIKNIKKAYHLANNALEGYLLWYDKEAESLGFYQDALKVCPNDAQLKHNTKVCEGKINHINLQVSKCTSIISRAEQMLNKL